MATIAKGRTIRRIKADGTGAYLCSPIGRINPHRVRGREPPYSNVLRRLDKGVYMSDAVMKRQRLARFPEPKRRLHLEGDGHDKAGGAEAAEGCDEEVGPLLARAGHAGAVGEEDGEGENVRGDDSVGDAGAVCRGGDDAAEGLVRDGADVAHGEAVLGELGMEGVERDAGLGDDVALVDMDLRVGYKQCKTCHG